MAHQFSTMYFFDIDILIKQILPPNWRVGEVIFLKAVSKPFKDLFNEFKTFRKDTITKINLSAQTMVIENHIAQMTGVLYGVYVADGVNPNFFTVNVPNAALAYKAEINQFLTKVTPMGRNYQLIFYV